MSYAEANGRGGYNEISTGPPAAKHRDHANSFKFGGASTANLADSKDGSVANHLVLSAPLSVLFESTVTFTLTYRNSAKNLTSSCTIHRTLRVNDTQWLILNLDGGGGPSSPIRSSQSGISTGSSAAGDQPPTLRLKLRLEGPYRPEIAALINLGNTWFHAVDAVTDATVGTAAGVGSGITGWATDVTEPFISLLASSGQLGGGKPCPAPTGCQRTLS